jgi:hypothetical protein
MMKLVLFTAAFFAALAVFATEASASSLTPSVRSLLRGPRSTADVSCVAGDSRPIAANNNKDKRTVPTTDDETNGVGTRIMMVARRRGLGKRDKKDDSSDEDDGVAVVVTPSPTSSPEDNTGGGDATPSPTAADPYDGCGGRRELWRPLPDDYIWFDDYYSPCP